MIKDNVDFFNSVFTFFFSNFSDIFDEEHFVNSLANDVKIIKKLPIELVNATRMVKQFISWSGMDYYENEIARLWEDYQVCMLKIYSIVIYSCMLSFFYLPEFLTYCAIVLNIYNFLRLFVLPNLTHGWRTTIYLQTFRSFDAELVMRLFVSLLALNKWEKYMRRS